MIKIAPSLLSADLANLEHAVELVAADADYIHCDVMDGHFVPNLTFGAPVVRALKRVTMLPLDVHLMIETPGSWVDDYIEAGLSDPDYLTFHIEAEADPEAVINRIREAGIKPGIVVKPGTPIEAAAEWISSVDQILIMTVEPGYGGQRFMHEMIPKIENLRDQINDETVIAVDGGIDAQTAPLVVRAGATLLVAGTSIYGQSDPLGAINAIRLAVGSLRTK